MKQLQNYINESKIFIAAALNSRFKPDIGQTINELTDKITGLENHIGASIALNNPSKKQDTTSLTGSSNNLKIIENEINRLGRLDSRNTLQNEDKTKLEHYRGMVDRVKRNTTVDGHVWQEIAIIAKNIEAKNIEAKRIEPKLDNEKKNTSSMSDIMREYSKLAEKTPLTQKTWLESSSIVPPETKKVVSELRELISNIEFKLRADSNPSNASLKILLAEDKALVSFDKLNPIEPAPDPARPISSVSLDKTRLEVPPPETRDESLFPTSPPEWAVNSKQASKNFFPEKGDINDNASVSSIDSSDSSDSSDFISTSGESLDPESLDYSDDANSIASLDSFDSTDSFKSAQSGPIQHDNKGEVASPMHPQLSIEDEARESLDSLNDTLRDLGESLGKTEDQTLAKKLNELYIKKNNLPNPNNPESSTALIQAIKPLLKEVDLLQKKAKEKEDLAIENENGAIKKNYFFKWKSRIAEKKDVFIMEEKTTENASPPTPKTLKEIVDLVKGLKLPNQWAAEVTAHSTEPDTYIIKHTTSKGNSAFARVENNITVSPDRVSASPVGLDNEQQVYLARAMFEAYKLKGDPLKMVINNPTDNPKNKPMIDELNRLKKDYKPESTVSLSAKNG